MIPWCYCYASALSEKLLWRCQKIKQEQPKYFKYWSTGLRPGWISWKSKRKEGKSKFVAKSIIVAKVGQPQRWNCQAGHPERWILLQFLLFVSWDPTTFQGTYVAGFWRRVTHRILLPLCSTCTECLLPEPTHPGYLKFYLRLSMLTFRVLRVGMFLGRGGFGLNLCSYLRECVSAGPTFMWYLRISFSWGTDKIYNYLLTFY